MLGFPFGSYNFQNCINFSIPIHWGIYAALSRAGGIYAPTGGDIDVLMQERRNSSALAMELRLSCTNPSIFNYWQPAPNAPFN